jgi:3-keto-5-aminohexanoate cleavage enzyme
VRVGLEDNIYFDRARTQRADNPRLVGRIARIARDMGRPPATPAEARALIGLR